MVPVVWEVSQVEKWEYKAWYGRTLDSSFLNQLGDEGWELVAVFVDEWKPQIESATAFGGGKPDYYRAIFKRRKS